MNYTPTTELEAVNEIIATIGESPINTLEGELPGDAVIARTLLHAVSRETQAPGCYFNTETSYPLVPDALTKEVRVPANTLRCDVSQAHYGCWNVVNRGGRLYDKDNHTYQFDNTIYADLVLFLPFTELPEHARRYIIVRAGKRFQDQSVGSQILHQFAQEDEYTARAEFLQAELANSDLNLKQNPQMAATLRRT